MSHNPPNGPPHPPPYYGYPGTAPPPVPGYAYMPAPVVMPMPIYHHPPPPQPEPQQPPPTYVTNYIYQQQPPVDPVQIVENLPDEIDWASTSPSTAAALAHRAFVGGKEGWDGSPLWIIRAHHNGEFIPGKLAIKSRAAYIPHGGKEVPVHNFEVLLAPQHILRWLPGSHGQVPVGAIPAGNTHNGEPLYIARVSHLKSVTPGKVHPSHGCAYISFGGSEISYKNYEVLCKIVG